MKIAESEAKTKWCPKAIAMVVAHYQHGDTTPVASANRPGPFYGSPSNVNCIGSQCMLWEWVDYENETASEYIGPSYRPNPTGHERAEQRISDGWEEYEHTDKGYRAFKRPHPARRGTCGLIQRDGQ